MSRTIAGVMKWAKWGANLDTRSITQLITNCLENGVNTFDHADIYGGYTTEEDWGLAWKNSGHERSSIEIITKCCICYPCDARPEYLIKHYNHSAQHIIESAQRSIKNLKCEYLDLLLIHRPGPLMNPLEINKAFVWLQERGLVKGFGVSNFTPSQMDMMRSIYPIQCNQIEVSLLMMDPLYNGTIDYCTVHNLEVQAWSPLGGGKLFSPSADYQLAVMRERLQVLVRKYNHSIEEIAYHFLLHHPSHIRPVTGSSKIDRIMVSRNCEESNINDELWYDIWTAARGERVP